MATYNIDVQTPATRHKGPSTETLRVRGETPNEAIMSAYMYLVRQYDGNGSVCETSLRHLDGRKVI
jgi:ribosomal protein S25